MFSSIVQKLNKSFGSANSDVTEASPNKMSPNSSSPTSTDTSPINKDPPVKSKKPCNLCRGAGCCVLCDREDEWEDMVYCTNKTERRHLIHHSCDNLTPEIVKHIKQYFCPNCRLDGNFEITFKKKQVLQNKKK